MVANIRGYTPNYGFKLINFDTPRWHTLEYANWSQLDSMFLQFGASGIRGEWQNATEYLIGERVFDTVNGLLYRCLVQHVSAISGSFSDDRVLHPTFWSLQLGGVPVFRGPWVVGNSYSVGDIVNVGYEYYLGTSNHIAVAPFPGNGPEWQTIFDATEVVTDATDAADAAQGSASSAAAYASDAQTHASNASDSEDAAADWAEDARATQGAFRWLFSSSLSGAPATGRIALNSAVPADVNEVRISALSNEQGNPDVSPWIITWDDSTNPTRGVLQLRKVGAPEEFFLFELISDVTNNGSWLNMTVQYINHNGTLVNNEELGVGFVRTGNAGPTGGGGGDMIRANNLSDVVSVPFSRNNLGLGTAQVPVFNQVTLNAAVTAAKHAATKEYVDGSPSTYVSDTQPPIATTQDGSLWWDSDRGTLLLLYNDGTSRQWVDAVAVPGLDLTSLVKRAGDTMIGDLTLAAGTPTAALHAAPKQYVDAPVDEKSYARRGATWAEIPRYQRVSLAGGKSFDVQVPAGAVMARLTGMIVPTVATAFSVAVQLSVTPGVFRSTVGDYTYSGFYHTTVQTPTAVAASNANSTHPGMLMGASNHATLTIMFDGIFTLKRPDTGHFFTADTRLTSGHAAVGQAHYFHMHYFNQGGSALALLALRILDGQNQGGNWGNDSYLHVEWM